MKKYIALIAMLFMVSGCEMTPVQEEGPSLIERLNSAAKSVRYIAANSPDWCTAASGCQYKGEIYCNTGSDRAAKKCKKDIGKKVIRAGGDTYVEQAGGMALGESGLYEKNGYYRSYGKVYKCTDKFKALYAEVSKQESNPARSIGEILSKGYFEKCKKKNTTCRLQMSETCGTIRREPFKLCANKIRSIISERRSTTAVIERETFNRIGAYRVFFNAYACK